MVIDNWPFAIFRTCGFPCGFLTSFYCDVTIAPLSDGPFDYDVIMKKSANRCDVGSLAIPQLQWASNLFFKLVFPCLGKLNYGLCSLDTQVSWFLSHHRRKELYSVIVLSTLPSWNISVLVFFFRLNMFKLNDYVYNMTQIFFFKLVFPCLGKLNYGLCSLDTQVSWFLSHHRRKELYSVIVLSTLPSWNISVLVFFFRLNMFKLNDYVYNMTQIFIV